jgi:hypothetical protein
MRERIVIVLVLFALAPFLMAAGSNPPVDSNARVVLTGPVVNAVVVIIANADSFPLADTASIWLSHGGKTAGAVFRITPVWNLGCITEVGAAGQSGTLADRFINHKLSDWIPNGPPETTLFQGDILTELFNKLDIQGVGPAGKQPVLVDVSNAVCTTNPGTFPGTQNPGYLSFQAAIQFLQP